MDFSYDSLIELKQHFVGALTQPCPFWLAPAEGLQVAFSGGGVAETPDGCIVDLGAVAVPGDAVRELRLENLGREPVTLRLEGALPPWLGVRWMAGEEAGSWPLAGAGASGLELAFRGTRLEEEVLQDTLRLVAESPGGESRSFAITVRLRTRLRGRYGRYDFNGSAVPARHDFGALDPTAGKSGAPAYRLRIAGAGDTPLRIELNDLPDWLTCEAGGATLTGPAAGAFLGVTCEYGQVVEAVLRPVVSFRFLGARQTRIAVITDDEREELRRLELPLAARIETAAPYLEALVPEPFFAVPPQTYEREVRLSNWGLRPARLELAECAKGLAVKELPMVDGAGDRSPGTAVVKVQISPQSLAPGSHQLRLALRVREGSPPRLSVPIRVTVVRVEIDPPRLDFGRVGERPETRIVHLRAADGRPLRLRAEPLPELAGLLTCSADAHGALHVEYRPGPQVPSGMRHDGPGITVWELTTGLQREIPVTLRTGAGPGWKIVLLLAVLVLAASAFALARHLF